MRKALQRELQRIRKNRRIIFAAVIVPLSSLLFMATIFGDGKIENLPVGIVDCDNSTISQQIIRTINASPITNISPNHIYSNPAEAKQAMQDMDILGYAVIPTNFMEDLYNGSSPTITYYYHNVLLAAGGEINSAFVKALGDISTSLIGERGNLSGIAQAQVESIALPTNGIFTSTYNATLNYGVFLSYPFFFIFFQIFILTFSVYVIGTDMKLEWLESGDGSILKALAGKMLPYTLVFILETITANIVFFQFAKIPLSGSFLAINASSILFVVTTIALGAAIISLIPKISIAISIASMVGALGATASGVTFPIENMYPAFEAICSLLPIRNFVETNHSILYNQADFGYRWHNYAIMITTILLGMVSTPLLKKSIIKGYGKPLPAMWGTSLVMIGGTVGYGILYGLMYHPNTVTRVPVAVVDNSQTALSREYIRNLNATQGIHIYTICQDIPQGEALMKNNTVKGIVIIPANFSRLVERGKESPFAVYETTTSFLYYLTIQKAIASTMQQVNNSLREHVVKTLPLQQQMIIAQTPSFTTNGVAVYNHNEGYGSYLLPIAIIVILFQTMLMCGGILAGTRTISPLRYLPYLATAYFLLSFFLAGLVPCIFNLPALANKMELFLFIFLFLLSTTAFTALVSIPFKDPEEVMLYVPVFSVALIFLSGTSFPMVQIPHLWQIVHYLLPTSPGITGYLKLNSMGGNLHNAAPQMYILLAQFLIYGSIFTLYTRKIVNLQKQQEKSANGKIFTDREPHIPL